MKIIFVLIFIFLTFFAPGDVSAQSQTLSALSNKELINMLQNEGLKDYCLYQPTFREIEDNTSKEEYLERINIYPIIFSHDDDLCLIIVKKIESQWKIYAVNKEALIRDGYTLTGFSINEDYFDGDEPHYVYFEFEDGNNNIITLGLQLSSIYPSYFSFVQSQNETVVFNYERGITIQYDFPFIFRVAFEVNPMQYYAFGVEDFSLAECPVTANDLFVRAAIIPKEEEAGLYAFPDYSMEPICYLRYGEMIYTIPQQNAADWTLVRYNGNLYFIDKSEVLIKK